MIPGQVDFSFLSQLMPQGSGQAQTYQIPQSGQTMQAFAGNQAQTQDMMNGLSMTQLGRLQLMARLTQQFGPNYQTHPQAQAAMKTFEDSLAKKQDLTSLQKLIEQGKRVEDYLGSMSTLAPSNSYQRLA